MGAVLFNPGWVVWTRKGHEIVTLWEATVYEKF